MRRSILGFSAAMFLAAAARAGSASDWERLKSLVGSWQGTAEGRPVSVTYTIVSNAKGSSGEVMQRLVVTFVDADHFHQQWTSRAGDGREHTSLFRYTRKK